MERIFVVSSRPLTAPPRAPSDLLHRRPSSSSSSTQLPLPRFLVSAFRRGSGDGASQRLQMNVAGKMTEGGFARVSRNSQTSAVGTPALPVPPPPSYVGSPLFWIGVGVGFSALFSWVANYLKKYAMQQAFKAMMGPMAQGNGPSSSSAMFPGSAFPIPTAASPTTPPPRAASPTTAPPPPRAASQPVVTVDISDAKVEPVASSTDIKEDVDTAEEQKRYSFVDVSPEDVSQTRSTEGFRYPNEDLPPNGSTSKQEKGETYQQSDSRKSSGLSVETLEKMMEDPTVQQMVYPNLNLSPCLL